MTQRMTVLGMAKEKPVTAKSVAEQLAIDAKSASKLLYRWEQKGLLARQREGEGVSSLRLAYCITSDGRRVLAKERLPDRRQVDFGPLVSVLGFPCAGVLAQYAGAQPRVTHLFDWET